MIENPTPRPSVATRKAKRQPLYLPLQEPRQVLKYDEQVEGDVEQVTATGSLADQVAVLEKELARLKRAEKALLESNDALTLLSETADELLSSTKPQEVINNLFEKLSARLGLEAYFNYLVDGEKGKLHLNSYAGIPPEVAKEIEWLEYGQAVCGCVARDGSRIVAEDIQHSADVRTDLVRSFGITAYACHPLTAHGRVIGTFSFGTSRKPCFDPHELALMQAVCDQVSLAMERILLISELGRRESAQRLLASASALLGSTLDYRKALADFAQLVAKSEADWCIVDVAEGEKAFRCVAVAPICALQAELIAELEQYRLLALDEIQSLQRVARTGQPEIYPELGEEALVSFTGNAREQRRLAELAIESAIVVPLSGRNEILGTMTLISAQSMRRYSPEDLALAGELASRAAVSIENARLYRAAQEAVHVRDEFLSVAAHELKTPVTSLRGFAQAVAHQFDQGKGIDPLRFRRTLEVIDRKSEKLAHLVSQLLDVSSIEAGQLALDLQLVEVGAIVSEVVNGVRITAAHHQFTVHVHEPIWINADPLRLEQVLRNLLDNAVKFSPNDGKIDIDVWSPSIGTLKLAVRDRGVGVPEEHRELIFDRLYQEHAADYSSGLGLGLYIARHIVELHGGKIEVECPADGGTRIVISLPTALADVKCRRDEESGEAER